MRKTATAFLLALILLCGCVQKLSPSQRLYCLDLTEKSHAFVPECKTQKECFSKLQTSFFEFDKTVFSSKTQSRLQTYQNNTALSWLYFNKARGEITKVHETCRNNSDISKLLFHLNGLTHNLAKAFEFAGQANKTSFEILFLEYSDLKKQDVELVKEEPLFNDFAALAENINDLPLKSCQTETYSCFHSNQTKNFSNLAEKTGFQNSLVQEKSVLDLVEPKSEELGSYLNKSFGIPFIDSVLPPLVSLLSALYTEKQAIEGLEKTPAFEFMQSYSTFMGLENSCLSRFSALVSENAKHRTELIERNSELENQLSQKIASAKQSMASLAAKKYTGFDQNFFEKLYTGLSQETTISSQKYSVQDFSQLREKAQAELSKIESELSQIKALESLGKISLGRKALSLKELNLKAATLKENMAYLETEILSGLIVLCNERALFVKQHFEKNSLPKGFVAQAGDLKARTELKIKNLENADNPEKKLVACSEMVEEFSLFQAALKDLQEYALKEEIALKECFSFLEKIFQNEESSALDLDGFKIQYHYLLDLEKPYPDLEAVKRNCLALKQEIEGFFRKQPEVKRTEKSLSESKAFLNKIQGLEENTLPEKELQSFEHQLSEFEKFFEFGLLSLEKAFPLLPDIDQGLQSLSTVLEEQWQALKPVEILALQTADQNQAKEFQAKEVFEKLKTLKEEITETERTLEGLEALFNNVSDQEVFSAKYVLPITRPELEKRRLELNSLKTFLSKKDIQDFLKQSQGQNFEEALEKSHSFAENLEEKSSQAELLNSRLKKAFESIKQDAVVSYNTGAELFNQLPKNTEAESVLEQAKKELLEGNYLKSIASSKNARSLMPLKPAAELNLPVFIWPVAICSILVFAVRLKKKKNAEEKSRLLKKIQRNW